jgi:hypothetical protein
MIVLGFSALSVLGVSYLAFASFWVTIVACVAVPATILVAHSIWERRRKTAVLNLEDPSLYTMDSFREFYGITWRWAWKDGQADPSNGGDLAARVADISGSCPRCGLPLDPGSLTMSSLVTNADFNQKTPFRCAGQGCNFARALPGSKSAIRADLCQLIERKVQSGEYRTILEAQHARSKRRGIR